MWTKQPHGRSSTARRWCCQWRLCETAFCCRWRAATKKWRFHLLCRTEILLQLTRIVRKDSSSTVRSVGFLYSFPSSANVALASALIDFKFAAGSALFTAKKKHLVVSPINWGGGGSMAAGEWYHWTRPSSCSWCNENFACCSSRYCRDPVAKQCPTSGRVHRWSDREDFSAWNLTFPLPIQKTWHHYGTKFAQKVGHCTKK